MIPGWLALLATSCVALAFLSTAVIIAMMVVRPQKMAVMDLVWPVTGLYWGPVAIWGLWTMGAPPLGPEQRARHDKHQEEGPATPLWEQVAVAATHCGAGCTLGDIIGEWLVYACGWQLFGGKLYAEYAVDFPLAFILGIGFQYFTIAPMRGLGLKDGLVAALKADTIAIVAFEIGLFGWMALTALVLFPGESIATWNHWFQMQIGMIVGFFTSYPANWLLLSKGLKEAM